MGLDDDLGLAQSVEDRPLLIPYDPLSSAAPSRLSSLCPVTIEPSADKIG
jgi:hypothetical protein